MSSTHLKSGQVDIVPIGDIGRLCSVGTVREMYTTGGTHAHKFLHQHPGEVKVFSPDLIKHHFGRWVEPVVKRPACHVNLRLVLNSDITVVITNGLDIA